jgi:hypothetical protein
LRHQQQQQCKLLMGLLQPDMHSHQQQPQQAAAAGWQHR